MTQTLEHIWDFRKAISELYRITKEKLIIDCPFGLAFHRDIVRDDVKWQEWDDYWRFTPAAMNRLLKEVGFKHIELLFEQPLVLCLADKRSKHL